MELQNHLFTVTELNQVIKDVLENSFFSINLEGELSNFRPSATGHWYFTLKDRNSNISAVMFKNSTYHMNFKPKDGMKIKVRGKLTLYSQRGTYQIVCNSMTQFGEGDILLMLEERKRKFATLGYFDPSLKKQLPRFPKTIGIITSPTGAALQDILKVLKRRHSLSNIIILPTPVQGIGSEKIMSSQIKRANINKLCDLIILARGGGSIEDLLPFSEESIIYSIYNSKIPIITGIGHEIDTSLCDLASDIRAATPSAAAELVTESTEKLYSNVLEIKKNLIQDIKLKISTIKHRLGKYNKDSVNRELVTILENRVIHVDNLKREMISNINWKIKKDKSRLSYAKESITGLSPYKLFEKGYSWVSKNGVNISSSTVEIDDELEIKYIGGTVSTKVTEK